MNHNLFDLITEQPENHYLDETVEITLPRQKTNFLSESINKFINGPPKIEIAIVGNRHVGKKSLIYYWLSLGSKNITNSNIYSKIFWLMNEPVQINIYKISHDNYLLAGNKSLAKNYHAIVYVDDLENIKNDNIHDIKYWIDKMKYYTNTLTYQHIIALTTDTELNERLDETEKAYKKFYVDHKIGYDIVPIKSSNKLSQILDIITSEAYDAVKQIPLINASDYGEPNMLEMNVFNENTDVPLLIRCKQYKIKKQKPARFDSFIYSACCHII